MDRIDTVAETEPAFKCALGETLAMTGRLNPRRYDLGELRDVVRDPPRRHIVTGPLYDPPRSNGEGSDEERKIPVEQTLETTQPESGFGAEHPESERADHCELERSMTGEKRRVRDDDPTEEVVAYLRSRHRRVTGNSPVYAGDFVGESDGVGGGTGASVDGTEQWGSRESFPTGYRQTPTIATILAALSRAAVSKPYLDRLPDTYASQLEVFDWLEGMLSVAGRDETVAALEYYESIGWLSETSREQLEEIVTGLQTPDTTDGSLDSEDHRQSLVFVARLAR